MEDTSTYGFSRRDAEDLLQGLGQEEEVQWTVPPRSALAGGAALFLTPSGGIPAMTGNGPWVWGVASCNRIDTDGELTESTADVHNSVSGAIPGNRVIQAKKIYGKWFADVVDCASSTGIDDDDGGTVPPGPDPEPPIDIGV